MDQESLNAEDQAIKEIKEKCEEEKIEEIRRLINLLDYNTFITFILLGQIRGAILIALSQSSKKLKEYCNRALFLTNINNQETNESNNICYDQYLFQVLLKRINYKVSFGKTPRQTYLERTIGGKVLSFGSNRFGQIALYKSDNIVYPSIIDGLKNIIQISSGGTHTLCLNNQGNVWVFGTNVNGQLGLGDSNFRSYPILNTYLSDIIQVSAAGQSSLCLDKRGNVWGFGSNASGQLGLKDTQRFINIPILIEALGNIVHVYCGERYSFCLDNKGQVWGLAIVFKNNRLVNEVGPSVIPYLSNIVQVSIGEDHALFLQDNGIVWGYGNMASGQLGLTDILTAIDPFNPIIDLNNIVQICCGRNHSVCLDKEGSVWVFGSNAGGELGLGDIRARFTPTKITLLKNIVQISCKIFHTLCLDNQGRVWVFGSNKYGQLGLGTDIDRLEPSLNAKLKDVICVVTGNTHSLCIVKP